MGERLEGILSETILDAIASDLGVDPDTMRKHPFFRVLKGQVLLTYPLKVATSTWFEPYQFHSPIATTEVWVPAAGTIVMVALLAVAAKLQVLHVTAVVRDVPAGAAKGHIGAIYCDGTKVKFKNTDVGEQMLDLEGVSTI